MPSPSPVASPASLGASPAKAVVEARSPGRGSGEGALVRRISFGAPPTQPGESSLVRRLTSPFTGGSSIGEESSILARLSSSFEAARHDAIDESGIDVGFLLL